MCGAGLLRWASSCCRQQLCCYRAGDGTLDSMLQKADSISPVLPLQSCSREGWRELLTRHQTSLSEFIAIRHSDRAASVSVGPCTKRKALDEHVADGPTVLAASSTQSKEPPAVRTLLTRTTCPALKGAARTSLLRARARAGFMKQSVLERQQRSQHPCCRQRARLGFEAKAKTARIKTLR